MIGFVQDVEMRILLDGMIGGDQNQDKIGVLEPS